MLVYAEGIQLVQATGLVVPKQWLEHHPSLFAPSDLSSQAKEPTHNLVAVQPVPLSEVILTAHTKDAYELSLAHRTAFEEYFFDERRILRQDSVYHLTPHDLGLSDEHGINHQYRLVMTSPVLQGCAKRGRTQLYVISLPPPANGSADSEPVLDDLQEIPSDEEDVGESEDGFEIDEAFLAGSVLHPVPASTEHATTETPGTDGHSINSSVYTRGADPLSSPRSSVEDDCTVYIPTTELGQIGVLSGDWVRAESEASHETLSRHQGVIRASQGTSSRLVRICAEDDVDARSVARILRRAWLTRRCTAARSAWPPISCTTSPQAAQAPPPAR